MVGLDVEDDGDGRVEGQEGVIVLAGFHDYRVAAADAVPRIQKRQRAADHNGRVLVRSHHDVRTHRGRGGLAVGAGDAQGVVIALDIAPQACVRSNTGMPLACAALISGVLIMHCRSAHDKFNVVRDVLGIVPDGDGDAFLPEVQDVGAFVHVGAGDVQPHAVEHFGQRGHGHPPMPMRCPFLPGKENFQIQSYMPPDMVLFCHRNGIDTPREK